MKNDMYYHNFIMEQINASCEKLAEVNYHSDDYESLHKAVEEHLNTLISIGLTDILTQNISNKDNVKDELNKIFGSVFNK